MAPKVNGSSTIGVKKSTVWTSARSAERRNTPASSDLSKPTRRFGFTLRGRRRSTWSKTFGLNLDAQPAALTCAVSFFADTRISVQPEEQTPLAAANNSGRDAAPEVA